MTISTLKNAVNKIWKEVTSTLFFAWIYIYIYAQIKYSYKGLKVRKNTAVDAARPGTIRAMRISPNIFNVYMDRRCTYVYDNIP